MKYSKLPKGTYRLCRVKEVKKSSADNLVRRAIVIYKDKDAKEFKEIDRPVQSLVMIVPVKEQGQMTDQSEIDNKPYLMIYYAFL